MSKLQRKMINQLKQAPPVTVTMTVTMIGLCQNDCLVLTFANLTTSLQKSLWPWSAGLSLECYSSSPPMPWDKTPFLCEFSSSASSSFSWPLERFTDSSTPSTCVTSCNFLRDAAACVPEKQVCPSPPQRFVWSTRSHPFFRLVNPKHACTATNVSQ